MNFRTEETCDTQPKFIRNVEGTEKAVVLNRGAYVKLLVDARVTDPACWPSGLESVAAMIERVQQIEDECIARHGEFDPEKLPRKLQQEYMEIHLALDELSEIEDADSEEFTVPEALRAAAPANGLSSGAEARPASTEAPLAPSRPLAKPFEVWEEYPAIQDTPHYA